MLTRLIGEKEIDYKIHHFEEGFVNNPTFIKQSMKELETICHRHGQEVSIIPMLALGKTDGRFFGEAGSQVLGFSPLTKEDPFESVLEQVHGNDESIAIESLIYGSHVIKDWLTSQCIGGINDDDTK